MNFEKKNLVSLSHEFALERLKIGYFAIDATAGNGNYTIFLAKIVGSRGRVFAFDVQEKAVFETRERLKKSGLGNAEVFLCGHEKMFEKLSETFPEILGNAKAILFNLGYLPKSDRGVKTVSGTTIPALEAAKKLLAPGGILLVTIYTKHAGGFEESAAVDAWISSSNARKIRRFGEHNSEIPWLAALEF